MRRYQVIYVVKMAAVRRVVTTIGNADSLLSAPKYRAKDNSIPNCMCTYQILMTVISQVGILHVLDCIRRDHTEIDPLLCVNCFMQSLRAAVIKIFWKRSFLIYLMIEICRYDHLQTT